MAMVQTGEPEPEESAQSFARLMEVTASHHHPITIRSPSLHHPITNPSHHHLTTIPSPSHHHPITIPKLADGDGVTMMSAHPSPLTPTSLSRGWWRSPYQVTCPFTHTRTPRPVARKSFSL
eukprot:6278102-Prymnesium_polylepis.2